MVRRNGLIGRAAILGAFQQTLRELPDSSLTSPGGQAELGSLEQDGITVGKQGKPFEAIDKALKAYQKSLSQAANKTRIAKDNDIRDIERLIKQWGGSIKNWEKMKGWMPSNNGDFDVEIHWYQNLKDGIGRVEPKSKLW